MRILTGDGSNSWTNNNNLIKFSSRLRANHIKLTFTDMKFMSLPKIPREISNFYRAIGKDIL